MPFIEKPIYYGLPYSTQEEKVFHEAVSMLDSTVNDEFQINPNPVYFKIWSKKK